jgi:S-DNA-T family DNA segregation ATPase FtsK/SpoIIIE
VLSLQVVAGPSAGATVPLERGSFVIGRAPECDVPLADPDASRRHAAVDVGATALTLRDLGSTNGTLVDWRPVPENGSDLRAGSLISIGDSLLTVTGPVDAPAAVQPGDDGTVLVLRPPRTAPPLPQREIELPVRPASTAPRATQWLAAVLPAAAGGILALLAHSPQFLLFALLSPVIMLGTALGDRVHWRRSRRRDFATYRRRLGAAERDAATGLVDEALARRTADPDPATVLAQAELPGSRVWERRPVDADWLRARVGVANRPSALLTRTGSAMAPAGVLRAVPVSLDLRRGPLGVAGPGHVVAAIGRWLVGQLATLQSPADLQLAFLLGDGATCDWAWARWLPHLQTRVATTESECNELVADLTALAEQRRGLRRMDAQIWSGTWFLLVVDPAAQLIDVPGLAALLARGHEVGLTALCVDGEVAALPATCAAVARVHGPTGTRLTLQQNGASDVEAVVDQVTPEWADHLARALAPLADATGDAAAIPARCRLPDLLGPLTADAIRNRWAAPRTGACTVLGASAQGPVEIDLARDGPHVLVAGTTGAGKSELLQTMVAGLAAHHPPEELNVVLVDYKGGAAFADCARLPHTAGLVTDLDPHLTERALRALSSELRRRERLFAEAGVSDLAGFRGRAGAGALPRLVIVVDEFAALAEELPEFIRGLVAVAQRGRSLGVHLVLATQRPGTAVSADIRANTGLRIALRVTDPAESADVIGSQAAALIERACPGRAYLRSGAALTCFQTAHASATTEELSSIAAVELLGPWRRRLAAVEGAPGETDLARLVDAVCAASDAGGRVAADAPWLSPLPDALTRDELGDELEAPVVALGCVDLPDEQRVAPLMFDLGAGASLLIAGSTRSGRTSALLSLIVGAATQLSPERLQLYVVDAGGGLGPVVSPLPHCGTVLGPDDLALTPRLLHRLEKLAAARLSGHRPTPASSAESHQLVVVDGWDALCSRLSDVDATTCAELMTGLVRAGPSAGLSVVVTGDRSVLNPRFAAGFGERLVLRLADRADFGLAGINPRQVPTRLPAGRGLRASDGAVVQLAHVGSRPEPAEIVAVVAAAGRRWAGTRPASAIRVRPLPAQVALRELPAVPGKLVLGLGGDDAQPVLVDPFAGSARLLVAGPPRSGRTTALCLLLRQMHGNGVGAVVAAPGRSALRAEAVRLGLPVLTPQGPSDPLPDGADVLLVDDSETFADTEAGELITGWIRKRDTSLAVVAAARSDELAATYRGIAVDVRRSRCGILLRPQPVDGELLGVRLPRRPTSDPPGRGVMVGDPSWGLLFESGDPVPIQVATP